MSWFNGLAEGSFHIAAVTAGEIQAGIEMTRRQDAAKAREIEAWLDGLLLSLPVLPATAAVFRKWAELMDRSSDDLIEDCLIAATAIVHNMTVATRNTRDFEAFPVQVFNPFDYRDVN
ncbi:hypothetical protein FHX08_000685 [Rhizobium sp. BK529]|nr:hypothetical protein [Rhizobium sp. BK529]